MLNYLFDWFIELDFPGAGVFKYISVRSAMSVITALIISTIFGKRMIKILQRKQVGESVRDLGLNGQMEKEGTPTMGGLIILISILVPALLFSKLENIYVILMLITTVWLGLIGFADDYIKVFKKNKAGLAGKFKVFGQVILGLIVGLVMFFHPDVVVGEKMTLADGPVVVKPADELQLDDDATIQYIEERATTSTIPFIKNNEFDYSWILGWINDRALTWTWLVFVLITIFIITAVSNGANMTDGLDGLATGSSAIMGVTLGILAYVSGHFNIADYLNIMYIPDSGELVVFMAAFVGATVGFLWYNSFPAQVFMGDTGSLTIGGIIAVSAVLIRKELLIPILCGIFLVENISVLLQVSWFKLTKKKTGVGKRIFLMAPLHHHYQKKGYPEPKIVTRFWIVGLILAVLTIVTLKIR